MFPAESYAEKEGTIVHTDGRVQRLRRAIGHQGETRDGWQVISDLAKRLGLELGVLVGPMASKQLVEAVPFYAGLTLEEIGGDGVRWPERDESAAAYPQANLGPFDITRPAAAAQSNGKLRLGSFRSIWAGPEVENSPALAFLHTRRHVEMSPADAERLNFAHGETVTVGANGSAVEATVALRNGTPAGTVFLEDGQITDALVEVTKRA